MRREISRMMTAMVDMTIKVMLDARRDMGGSPGISSILRIAKKGNSV